jgi:hypothetical protein
MQPIDDTLIAKRLRQISLVAARYFRPFFPVLILFLATTVFIFCLGCGVQHGLSKSVPL